MRVPPACTVVPEYLYPVLRHVSSPRVAALRRPSPYSSALWRVLLPRARHAQPIEGKARPLARALGRFRDAAAKRAFVLPIRSLEQLDLLATEACQVQSEDASYGHLVLRLMASFVLFYTSRVVCKGRLTMEEIVFSLKHSWRFVDLEAMELQALSSGISEQAA